MSASSGPQSNAPQLTPFAQAHPFRLTEPPNVEWKVGDGLSKTPLGQDWKTDEELGWKTWDMAQTSPSYVIDSRLMFFPAKLRGTGRPLNQPRDATHILNSTVVPRPIAFVSTLSVENVPNLAPFRYGNCLARLVFRSES